MAHPSALGYDIMEVANEKELDFLENFFYDYSRGKDVSERHRQVMHIFEKYKNKRKITLE